MATVVMSLVAGILAETVTIFSVALLFLKNCAQRNAIGAHGQAPLQNAQASFQQLPQGRTRLIIATTQDRNSVPLRHTEEVEFFEIFETSFGWLLFRT
jgi:hypothetical protein